ncbi:MAG: calcineurin-like phosphoesterase C-terminal domain-containing protein [Alistipes sp.]|nr:calcineurin-like phosphoesterase C-terminal domain-containing protein [Alistipes sp.]
MKRFINLLLVLLVAASATAQTTFTSQLKASPSKGATIYGTVECDGKPLSGVVISDGYEVVKTDKRGVYNIASAKRNGYVFITLPAGYEAMTEGSDVVPQIWAELTADAQTPERHDFTLRKADNDRHVIVAVADIHLANHHNDIGEFTDVFLPSLRAELEQYRQQGIPAYTLALGDCTHEIYWYDYLYDIGDFRRTLSKVEYPTQFFNTMGNHDNDGGTPHSESVDFDATAKYRKAFGPTYYSFNIGKIHYVMLDNIHYINEPGGKKAKGIVGSRNYTTEISRKQMDWLAKDLALVDKSTPVFIGVHSPIFQHKNGMNGAIISRIPEQNAAELTSLLKDFEVVHILGGHTHRNRVTYGRDDAERPELKNITDHNIVAVAGSLWYSSGFGGPQIGSLGEPAGCKIFPIDGTDIKWYFKASQYDAGQQFTCFDMNEVRRYFKESGEANVFFTRYPKRTNYGNFEAENVVMINVWDWASDWKISVKENGRELDVKRKKAEHPHMLACLDIPNTLWLGKFSSKNNRRKAHPHMFHVVASSPDSTIEVTVTDSFGNVYTEKMERPKRFHRLMK